MEERDFYTCITARRAEVLKLAAQNLTERQMAEHLGIDVDGVRSHVRWLKEHAGCRTLRELGPWWVEHRAAWLRAYAEAGGVPETGSA
jgi:FixJ family two-component response regulator